MENKNIEEEKTEFIFDRSNQKKFDDVKRSVNIDSQTEQDMQMTNTMIVDEIYETMLPDDKIVDYKECPKALFD